MGYLVAGGPVAASQQIGANQTDVFTVDENGQLNVSWVGGEGTWQGPLAIGPVGNANPGSFVAASQQFGLNQTDVFLVDKNGQLNVFWVSGEGGWNGPLRIGPLNRFVAGSFVVASRQFGADQTDVFLVDANGQLNVFWVWNAGAWNGPLAIGDAGIAAPGGIIAVSQQFGLNQTDVFLVNQNGQLIVFWVSGEGAWNGPEMIGDGGIAIPGAFIAASQQFGLNQTDVFLVDKNGQLAVFWVSGAGAWNGPLNIGGSGLAEPGSVVAVSQQFGLNQTDVFLVDKNGQLNVFWVSEAGAWNGPQKISGEGIASPGAFVTASRQFNADQTDVFLIDRNGQLNIFWVWEAGPWSGPEIRLDPVPAPRSGLGSSTNYVLYSDCNPLKDLSVTILVTQAVVEATSTGTIKGFSFQLNAYSPKNQKSAWQQYIISLRSGSLFAQIQYWGPVDGKIVPIVNGFSELSLLPPPANVLPAGYQLKISLQNDSDGVITGATFLVVDNHGDTQANTSMTIASLPNVTPDELAPIIAFELDLVGPTNFEGTVLSSGAGMIVYVSSSLLTVLNSVPSCAEVGGGTAETANSAYGVLSSSSSEMFSQNFYVRGT